MKLGFGSKVKVELVPSLVCAHQKNLTSVNKYDPMCIWRFKFMCELSYLVCEVCATILLLSVNFHAHVWAFVNFNKCSNFVVKCELLQRKGAWWMFDENVEWPTPEVCQVKINTIWNRHFELLFIDVTSNRIQIWEITIVILLIYLTFCHSYKRQTSEVLFGL
jgi:hypothetical protein